MPDPSDSLTWLMSNVALAQPIAKRAREEKGEWVENIEPELRRLASSLSKFSEEVEQALDLRKDSSTTLDCRVAAVGLLLKRSVDITNTAHALKDATVQCIISRLMSFDECNSVQKLLLHFKIELEAIIEDVYQAAGWDQDSMVKILEACLVQAYSGNLHVDDYFTSLYEANLESPYDPDFESEAYYEHENRLQVDDGYAEAESRRKQRVAKERCENQRRTHHSWIKFWIKTLHACPGGPTLFWPYPSQEDIGDLPDTPSFLFRTFDASSSGLSNDAVVASPASMQSQTKPRRDFLSLELEDRAQRLCAHLQKSCFGDNNRLDDLMSWSSSLLFVLQYAIWRCNVSKGRLTAHDVSICIVDTSNFPRGQFARDLWLLGQCRDPQAESPGIRNIFRLRKKGYDNGEYLSQGLLVHRDRSVVVSLQDLIQSGLYNLFPELDHPKGKMQWTNHVKDLRDLWKELQPASHEELRMASEIAVACFRTFRPCELAIILLTFKNCMVMNRTSERESRPTAKEDSPVFNAL